MGSKEHLQREISELHQGSDHGCIWRHEGGYGSYRTKACHYRKNGFQATESRKALYNEDHRDNAVRLGYADWGPNKETIVPRGSSEDRFEQELGAAAGRRTMSVLAKFTQKFRAKFKGSLKWLEYHEEGWHYGHRESAHPVHGQVEVTFKPKDKDTYAHGAWYPYHHEYHHLIPVSALREHVITDQNVDRRIEVLLATKWNINKGENVMCLPTEVSTAAIVELPAHCPWDALDHPEYSKSLKDQLAGIKEKLDKAMEGEKPCESELAQMSQQLDDLAAELLDEIKQQAGGTLGQSSAGGAS